MTELDKSFYINTGRNGILADTSAADVDKLVTTMKKSNKVVLYFHGGLVNKKSGLKTASTLHESFVNVGAHPVFFIWESGLLETLGHNFDEIDKDEVFKVLVKYAIQYAVGKITDLQGGKATGNLHLPNDLDVAIELQKRKVGAEPYAQVQPSPNLKPLNDAERQKFEKALQSDADLQTELRAIAASNMTTAERKQLRSKGVSVARPRARKTMLSKEIVEEVKQDVVANQGKGIVISAALILRAGKVLTRVVNRFLEKRDHGPYCTVVEEILREFYFDRIGTSVWEMMKKETGDTFENDGQGPARGGWYFLKKLDELLQAGYQPEITIIGHSAGSIFACNLLRTVLKVRQTGEMPGLQNFRFKNVVFLAPACDFMIFNEVLSRQDVLFDNFRMFALNNAREAGKVLIKFLPFFYTRSLLYFVSGMLEREAADPKAYAFDAPLVGMQRYYLDTHTYKRPEINAVRAFLDGNARRIVWAGAAQAAANLPALGLRCSADEHGGFAEEKDTLDSLVHIVEKGWDV